MTTMTTTSRNHLNCITDSKSLGDNPNDKKSGLVPEFARVQRIYDLFGVKRGILYRWIKEGKVKSISIKEPGKKQGIRLIEIESVRAHLKAQQAGQQPYATTSTTNSKIP